MATKIKGIYKSFKFISQIFVVKEREMEIGYPTDVKHVAHIGWDGPCGNAPSWMNEFKTPEFSTSLVDMGEVRDSSSMGISTSSSIDFELSVDHQQSDMLRDVPSREHPQDAKKYKRKKTRSSSSPKSSSFMTRSSRSAKSKVALHIMEGKQHQTC